jgi:hypothetical protein
MKTTVATTFWRVWKWPFAIAGASAFGLVSALAGDGIWDALSWVALGVPVAISIVALRRKGGNRGQAR